MALPTNNSRPAIPYVPTQILPNYNRYESLGNFPPTAQQFDGDLNAIMDFINTLADAINNTAAGIFPGADDPLNASKLPTTDGAGNVSWTLINALNLDVNAVQTQHIQNSAVTSDKIQPQAIGTNQLADGGVTTPKIADGAVTPPKIPANSLSLSKWVKPQTASVIGGTTTNGGSWYELTIGNYQIASKRSDNNGVTAMTLDVIWSNTAATFDGGKLTNNSVDINKLISPQYSGVIASTTTQNTFFVLPLTAWQLACRTNTSGGPTAQTLDVIWSNTAATFDGAKITPASLTGTQMQDNSVPLSKIQSPGPLAPFALASVNSDCSLNKSFNIAAVTPNGTGLYRVAFANPASSANAVVIAVTSDGRGVNTVVSDQSTQAVVIRLMNLQGQNVNGGFDLVVYDW